ncbi:hypothetical protein VSR82_37240 [Burkholderia sp. JPY481]
MALTLIILVIVVAVLLWRYSVASKALSASKMEAADLAARLDTLRTAKEESDSTNTQAIATLQEQLRSTTADRDSLAKFVDIRDTALEADRIRAEASQLMSFAESKSAVSVAAAEQEATRLVADATAEAKLKRSEAEQVISRASLQAAKVLRMPTPGRRRLVATLCEQSMTPTA